MNVYVVNYKETTTNESGVMEVESGVCDVGYLNEKDAIKKCWELTDDKFNEYSEENDAEMEKNPDNDEIFRDSNDNGDWQCFHYHNDTYEYWVTVVDIDVM